MVIVGDEVFKTKKDVTQKVRDIMYSYEFDTHLNPKDKLFIENLLYNHPDSELKIGAGIKAFVVRQNPKHRSTCNFFILRIDGTETDFSFVKCITAPSAKQKFAQACRKSVEPYIQKFKREFFEKNNGKTVCPFNGTEITSMNSHVDHIPPDTFENIMMDFIEENNIDLENAPLKPPADNKYGQEFDDLEFKRKWIDYHNNRAKLRVVSALANLSTIKKEANKLNKKSV